MTAPVLKSTLGEGGAGFDDSHGEDRLLGVLQAMVRAGVPLNAVDAGALSTGVKATVLAGFDGVIGNLTVRIGTAGTASDTEVTINKNGVALATTLTVDNADTDDVAQSLDLSADPEAAFVKGDLIDIELTSAATNGADLDAVLNLQPASIQA